MKGKKNTVTGRESVGGKLAGSAGKGKRGLNLMVKIVGIVMIPLVILVLFALFALNRVGSQTAMKMAESELEIMAYMMEQNIMQVEGEEFNNIDGQLYKGETRLSGSGGLLDDYKRKTGIETAIFIGTDVVAASMEGVAGDMGISKYVSDRVLKGESVFDSSHRINGSEYLVYLETLYNEGTPVGMMMTAVKVSEMKSIYGSVINTYVILMIVLVVLFCASGGMIAMIIVRALMSVVGNLDKVAEGQLNMKISSKLLKRSDEVGKIARAVYSVVENFSQTIANIFKSMKDMDECTSKFSENFDSITQSIENINIAVNDIAEGATQQAADTQDVGVTIRDMDEAISEAAESVSNLSDSAGVMQQNNEMVDATLKELQDISVRTSRSVDEVQKQTNVTNESVQNIRAATDIIAGIASQTNLLSLNASIEAARAGDMGRGFAVVAEEIRGLADQSKESADKIRGIVENLIQNSDQSVEIMHGVVDEIRQQNEKLEVTQRSFDRLNGEIHRVVTDIDAISNQLGNIERYKNGVVQSMGGLNEISQNNAASTEETAATMDQLAQIVAECKAATANLVNISNDLTQNAKRFNI